MLSQLNVFSVFYKSKVANQTKGKRNTSTFPSGIAHSHIHESATIDQLSKSIVVSHNPQINEKLIFLFPLLLPKSMHFSFILKTSFFFFSFTFKDLRLDGFLLLLLLLLILAVYIINLWLSQS